jgi:hypothetical protein
VFLRELFYRPNTVINEGGNLSLGDAEKGEPVHYADKIDLKVHNRTYMVGLLNKLLHDVNAAFHKQTRKNLFSPELLKSREFLSGSSLHFFNTDGISDEEFTKYKPRVGDIDTQVDRDLEPQVKDFLTSHTNKRIGDTTLLGFGSGNEQYNALFQFANPPLKIQIDFEFGEYEGGVPNDWFRFSHSSEWNDVTHNVKGVFHKYLYRALAGAIKVHAHLKSTTGRGKAKETNLVPDYLSKYSFGVSGKQGGGLSEPYSSVQDDNTKEPQELPHPENPQQNLPVMQVAKPENRIYDQNLQSQFKKLFLRNNPNAEPTPEDLKQQWSFLGTVDLIKKYLNQKEQQETVKRFFEICFEPGSQMIERDDPKADSDIKFAAIDIMLEKLNLTNMRQLAIDMAKEYEGEFLDLEKFKKSYQPTPDQAGKKIQYGKHRKDAIAAGTWPDWRQTTTEQIFEAEVQAQLRKGMPHLHDLKAADFLDLVDEIHDGNGRFQLANIPLNVKVDGMGGRFGKSADGRPFMGTSRTEPRYVGGFLKGNIARFKKRILAQQNGIADPKSIDDSDPSLASITDQQALDAMGPDSVAMSKKFDEQFNDYMDAIKIVDDNLGDHFLVNRQVTCEVLDINFATETPEGKLKFVGIHYDKLPEGVKIVLVPFRVTDATTGKDLPDTDRIIQQLTSLGQQGKIMFLSNKLQQKQPLDVTEIINILDNVEELKSIVSNSAGKRDHASLQLRREVEAKLEPVKIALEKAIINDPNIIGKDMLGQNYEGIVINSRLGPIKVTSQEQRDVISAKNAAKASARTERPRGESKTAVVAIGSAVGHIGHQQLFNHAIQLAKQNGGDPYLFLGNAEGKDDPIPVSDKLKTWHMLYPQYANHIGTVTMEGGTLLQKVKHELINPLKDKPPRYDTIYIVVGKDREEMANQMSAALMKAVNKFQGYEHVRVIPEVTERDAAAGGTGVSFTTLRKALKNQSPEQAFASWDHAFNTGNFGAQRLSPDWIKHLMDVSRKGMGIGAPRTQHHTQKPAIPATEQEPLNIKETNNWIRQMRAKEFLKEGDIPADLTRMDSDAASAAIKGGLSIPGISQNKSNGSPYQGYRFGIAMAVADGKGTNHIPPAGPMAGDPLLSVFTDEEYEIIQQAAKDTLAGPIKKLSSMRSEEVADTNKISPVAKVKRNKYGV